MKIKIPLLLFVVFIIFNLKIKSQGYTNWVTGDTADFVTTDYLPGIVLAGGGGDNDDAMRWMLGRAGGGDVVVIRASGSDGYNDYFFSELGMDVNSVETIRFDDVSAATLAYVLQKMEQAEVLFIAGGDQYDYYQFWKDNEVEEAINFLINEKQITVGGTSAGMAILGNAYYTPPGGSAVSDEVLSNPFHPNVDILGQNDFIENPYLPTVITDTHFDQRERAGRLMVFLARLVVENNERIFAIACNEYTGVCIDGIGNARVYGEYPEYDDFAYFLETNCQADFLPEILEANQPLTWNKNMAAVKAYRLPGTVSGNNYFYSTDWVPIGGGEWFDWYVEEGVLFQNESAEAGCGLVNNFIEIKKESTFEIYPTLVSNSFLVKNNSTVFSKYDLTIYNLLGQQFLNKKLNDRTAEINIGEFNAGIYLIKISDGNKIFSQKIIKK